MKTATITYTGGKKEADEALEKFHIENPDFKGRVIVVPEGSKLIDGMLKPRL